MPVRFVITSTPFYKACGTRFFDDFLEPLNVGDVLVTNDGAELDEDGDLCGTVERTGAVEHVNSECLTLESSLQVVTHVGDSSDLVSVATVLRVAELLNMDKAGTDGLKGILTLARAAGDVSKLAE